MKIFVIGGAGFVKSHRRCQLLEPGHRTAAFGTAPQWRKAQQLHRCHICAGAFQPGSRQQVLTPFDAVVNLAGKTSFKRRIEAYRQQGTDGRIRTNRNMVNDLPAESGCVGSVQCNPSALRSIVDQPADQEQTQQG